MTAVVVAFMIVFAQMGATCASCHDLLSAQSDQNSLVLASEQASLSCDLSNCGLLCQITSQEKPFSVPKFTKKTLLNSAKVAAALNSAVMESFPATPFLWPSTAKTPSEFGVEVYLLNTSFLI